MRVTCRDVAEFAVGVSAVTDLQSFACDGCVRSIECIRSHALYVRVNQTAVLVGTTAPSGTMRVCDLRFSVAN